MKSENKRLKAKIGGKEYTVIGKYPEEHLKTVFRLVNKQLDELQKLAPHLSKEDRAVLLAVNAVSDQLESEARLKKNEPSSES